MAGNPLCIFGVVDMSYFYQSPPSFQYGASLKCTNEHDLLGRTLCPQRKQKALNVYGMC